MCRLQDLLPVNIAIPQTFIDPRVFPFSSPPSLLRLFPHLLCWVSLSPTTPSHHRRHPWPYIPNLANFLSLSDIIPSHPSHIAGTRQLAPIRYSPIPQPGMGEAPPPIRRNPFHHLVFPFPANLPLPLPSSVSPLLSTLPFPSALSLARSYICSTFMLAPPTFRTFLPTGCPFDSCTRRTIWYSRVKGRG